MVFIHLIWSRPAPCLPPSLAFFHFLNYGCDPYLSYFQNKQSIAGKDETTSTLLQQQKIIYLLIVLSSSSDFGCNWVKAGTKHTAVEEKLEVIEEQVDLDEEDEITMRVFGKNELSEIKYISSLHSM